ncbi:MAG: hypothetical protein Q4A35_02990 [Candidatus Gracilibacteria bacterium]|nr:hypothetical protein [Candidatus Gracilibacteria bacterium]
MAHQITKVILANSLKTKEEIDLLHKNDMEIEKRLKTLSPAQLNQLSAIIQGNDNALRPNFRHDGHSLMEYCPHQYFGYVNNYTDPNGNEVLSGDSIRKVSTNSNGYEFVCDYEIRYPAGRTVYAHVWGTTWRARRAINILGIYGGLFKRMDGNYTYILLGGLRTNMAFWRSWFGNLEADIMNEVVIW